MSGSSGGTPAGGLLLDTILECYVSAAGETGLAGDDAKRYLKERVLAAVLGCQVEGCRLPGGEKCWRDLLGNSLRLADSLLEQVVKTLEETGGTEDEPFEAVVDMVFVLRSPGLVGAGGGLVSGVFEVGLEIDRLLGLPYYPGSTIKGAVRSFTNSILSGRLDEDKAKTIVESVFGTSGKEGRMGSIVFYDSYPIGCLKRSPHPCLIITGGVVTPHYYKGGKPIDAEYEAQPRPVQHLVIAPGTAFRVVMGVRCPRKGDGKPDVEAASRIIEAAMSLVGAQRSVECKENGGRCSCINEYASAIAILTAATLSRGFAARSGKGYNVLGAVSESSYDGRHRNITRDIMKLKIKVSPPSSLSQRQPQPHGAGSGPRQRGPRRHPSGRRGSGYSGGRSGRRGYRR